MVDAVSEVLLSFRGFDQFEKLFLEGTFVGQAAGQKLSALCRISACGNELLRFLVEVAVGFLEVLLEDEEILEMVEDELQERNVEGWLKV